MSRIRSRGTLLEARFAAEAVVPAAVPRGQRFELNAEAVFGRPDVWFPGARLALFVDGCFWHPHGCRRGRKAPHTNRAFWKAKLARNRERAEHVMEALGSAGISAIRFASCRLLRPGGMEAARKVVADALDKS
jgi:DNA mismatch endonuclease (patch repair protein)